MKKVALEYRTSSFGEPGKHNSHLFDVSIQRPQRIGSALAFIVSTFCAMVMAGWLLEYDNADLDYYAPRTSLVSAAALLTLAIVAQSRALFPQRTALPWKAIRLVATAATIGLGVIILARYTARIPDAGSPLGRDLGVAAPGTAIVLLLNGAALAAIDTGRDHLASRIATCCLVVCELSMVGYLFDQAAMRETLLFGYMAPLTAFAAAVLSFAILCIASDRNWVAEIVKGGYSGLLRGRLVAAAILLPIVVQALSAWIVASFDVPAAVGRALVAVILGIVLTHEILHASRLHQRSQELSARLGAIIESSEDAIVGKDLDGIIVSWNESAERLFGYRETEILGQTLDKLIPSDRPEEERIILASILRGQRLQSFETRRVRKDGVEVDVSVTVSPILAPDGSITGISSITRDISALVNINAQLRQSNVELEQFAYVASHDMREPLRMVANYAALLEEHCEGELDETAQRYLHHVSQGAMRMQQMIGDLLTYSRVDPQGQPLTPTPLDPVLRMVAALYRDPLQECGGELTWKEMPIVLGDDVQLGQVFQNLIGNAIKFRSEQPLRIIIDAREDGGMWTFRVADNGIGFETDHAERIFDMFQRLNSRSAYPGSGIGLAIVRRVIERHGGATWIASQPGQGTEVFFTLKGA